MKLIKYLFAVAALTCALTLSAKADLKFIDAVDFNNGPNGPPESNLNVLIGLGIDPSGFVLCGNIEDLPEDAGDQTIDVMPGAYLVVHYGKGSGGTGNGGSWEVFQVINGETEVTVPGTGNGPDNPDPFGHGGVSSIREFCGPSVPDGGTTAALLGLGLTGLAGLRARFGRN